MPITANGTTVYRIGEALLEAGLSRATYFRWVREQKVADTRFRDRNGRRVFTAQEVQELCGVAHRLIEASPQLAIPLGAGRG
jgi:DNA-binding transcriptional MerR regulator